MSRKPIDQVQGAQKPQGQDGVWAQIRKLGEFSVPEIVAATDINRKTVTDCIKRLEAGGIVERLSGEDRPARFRLLRDAGVHIPRFRPDGTAVLQGSGTENMWRSMRMMQTFSPRDIAAHSTTEIVQVSEGSAMAYCKLLLATGYLRVVRKAVPGKRQAVYRLVRNSGPLPPMIQRVKQVFDQNTSTVYRPGESA